MSHDVKCYSSYADMKSAGKTRSYLLRSWSHNPALRAPLFNIFIPVSYHYPASEKQTHQTQNAPINYPLPQSAKYQIVVKSIEASR